MQYKGTMKQDTKYHQLLTTTNTSISRPFYHSSNPFIKFRNNIKETNGDKRKINDPLENGAWWLENE